MQPPAPPGIAGSPRGGSPFPGNPAPACPPDLRNTRAVGRGNISACSLQASQGAPQRGSPPPLLPAPGSPEQPRAGPPLTQQDEGNEQHDEDGDAEDERKPSLAHAGSSEHGGSWQQGRGRVRVSGCLPRVPTPCCPPTQARSSLAPQRTPKMWRAGPCTPCAAPVSPPVLPWSPSSPLPPAPLAG